LRSSTALSRTAYRPVSVNRWLAELETLLGQSEPSTASFGKNLVRFTPAALAQGTKEGRTAPSHPFFGLCERLEQAGLAATGALDSWRLGLEHKLVGHVRSELGLRKATLGIRSFGDLLEEVAQALRGPRGPALARRIRQRHPAALIDEFQDTDPVQYEIMSTVYSDPGSVLLLIGDPKQAIYGFRGADVFAYLNAAARIGTDRTHTLRTNYRSDPTLVGAVNALFSGRSLPFLFDEIGFVPAEARPGASDELTHSSGPLPALELVWVPRRGRTGVRGEVITKRSAEVALPALVAGHVLELLRSGATRGGQPIGPGDIAVLTRTNRQASAVGRALGAVGIPSVLFAQASVLDSPEAPEVAALLRALVTPTHGRAVRTALATSLFGLGAAELHALGTDESAWQLWLERFAGWHELWRRRGFMPAFRRCLGDARVVPGLLGRPGGERRLTNVLHLGELLHEAASSGHLGMASLVRWFAQVRHDPGAREEVAGDARQIRLETDEHAVLLVTMHKSKGLEYPIVICPYLWDGALLRKPEQEFLRYHDRADGLKLKLDLRPPEDKAAELALGEEEALSEQLRLLYVALTRARHRVTVFAGAFNTYEKSALAYLLHQGPGKASTPREVAARVRALDDRDLMADLEAFARRAERGVKLRELALPEAGTWQRPLAPLGDLRSQIPERRLALGWRSSSFTALVSHTPASPDPGEGARGRDEMLAPGHDRSPSEARAKDPVPLDKLPRGAAVGTLVHSVLERVDWQKPEELGTLVGEALERRPDLGAVDASLLAGALGGVVSTPFDADRALSLAELSTRKCLRELEFLLPVRGSGKELDAARLAEAFERWAEPPVPPGYAARVAALGFTPLLGYLRGFIDLVFEHAGRYFVVDYKTNHLGPSVGDYASEKLVAAMAEHHYLLQYHLYTLALHRLLRARLPGYRYDAHFGGVYYLFVRGMAPSFGAGHGVFFDRPPLELVTALEAALDREGA
jgi:exodeoxyribonuclease V beta subunit